MGIAKTTLLTAFDADPRRGGNGGLFIVLAIGVVLLGSLLIPRSPRAMPGPVQDSGIRQAGLASTP